MPSATIALVLTPDELRGLVLTAFVVVATALVLVRVVRAMLARTSSADVAAINERLTESERRYRTLTDAIPQMVGILDATATLFYANHQWSAYTGVAVGVEGLPHADRLVHPDDAGIAATLLETMKAQRESRAELRIRRWDQTYRWHDVRIVPVADGSGRTDQWIFTCTDIEEQHAARAAFAAMTAQLVTNAVSDRTTTTLLREQNRLLSMAEEIAHLGHWRFDLASSELLWSDEIYRTFGLPMTFRPALEEAITVYHPDDRELVSAHVEKAITHGMPFSFEARIVRPDGEIRYVVSAGQSEGGADQAVVAIFGVLQDVTERKTSQREQEHLIVRYDVATRGAEIGIWDWDVVTDTVAWNPVMVAIYGVSDRPFTPSHTAWAAALHPDDRVRAERELAEAAAGNGTGDTCDTEFRVVRPNGDVRIVRATAAVLRDRDGSAQRIIGTNTDITAARALASAAHDTLTGVMNRGALDAWIASRPALDGTLIAFAVEGLGVVNERGGLASGDATLRAVAAIIEAELREADRCARIESTVFVVVLPGVSSARTVRDVSARIESAVASLRPIGPLDETAVRLSRGTAILANAESFSAALHHAETDRYRRKNGAA